MSEKPAFTGTIIEESLADNRILNSLEITKVRISEEANPSDRWHMYSVRIFEKDISRVSAALKAGWYAHFWSDKKMIVVFKDTLFTINPDDKSTWTDALAYGRSVGISDEQLDFLQE